ncbi:hypothetical protein PCASD_13242 [Puccinia coronata f. sp. avenae]|uniref:Nucleoporin POM34 n=1 Tax=Puccinia coronata f. sp. avenae TaxID=200324 RepID=A0A2N5UGD0_9BASI|nr:hypothetical protein PCASD_13242 [Puccinia coronata f. sp. avenae]
MNSPSSVDSPLKRFSQQEPANKAVHFSTPIVLRPQRLFQTTSPGTPLHTSTPNNDRTSIYPNAPLTTPLTTTTTTTTNTNANANPSDSQRNWIQELVDQPNKPINQKPLTPFNHFSKTVNTLTTTTTPQQQNLTPSLKSQLGTPIFKSSPSSLPSTPAKPHHHHHQQQQQQQPRNQSSRIPISLNPLINSGLKLGQKRLIERIRINLISLIIVWMVTSTRIYNEIVLTLSARIPLLSVPLQILEWLLLVLLIGNVVEGYYKLKTQTPITHVDLPLTPQQIRGAVQTCKNGLSSSVGNNMSPFRRSTHSPLMGRTMKGGGVYSPSEAGGHEVLSQDPTVNPLSRSTAHLFKRSLRPSPTSSNSNSASAPAAHQPQIPDWHHPAIRSPAFSPAHHALNRSLRSVSNQASLQKLLDETLSSS